MAKKTIGAVDVSSRVVLMRVDFNVPLDGDGKITDDRRIRLALPSIESVIDRGGRLVLMSHLGRPTGDPEIDKRKFSLRPVAKRLSELLDQRVDMAPNCVGDDVVAIVRDQADGSVTLLENLRFHKAETIKDKDAEADPALKKAKQAFAKQLADLADVYVNDAFGTCHRDNASMLTVPQLMEKRPHVVGFLVEKELKFLGEALRKPERPFVAILGGAKVSDKIPVITALIPQCDAILIGGAMAYTFFKAEGISTGDSLVEPDRVDDAKQIREAAGEKLHLPVDSVVAAKLEKGAATQVVEGNIPDGKAGFDIGPKTILAFNDVIAKARTIVWNGPMGVFETPPFDTGTMEMARAIADATDAGAISVIGGGDSAAAVEAAGLADKMTHVSTGGGASLEFLEGKPFQAIEVLDDA